MSESPQAVQAVITRLPASQAKRLAAIAKANDRSVASELRRLVRTHLDAIEQRARAPAPNGGAVEAGAERASRGGAA